MKRFSVAVLSVLLLATLANARVHAQDTVGSITAAQGAVTLSTPITGNGSFQITGTWTGTLAFEASNNNIVWVALSVTPTDSTTTVTSTTGNGIWTYSGAFKVIRVRASAFSSGTANVTVLATWARAGGGGSGGGGSGTVTSVDGTSTAQDKIISGGPVVGAGTLTLSQNDENPIGNTGSSPTVNWNNGTTQSATLNAATVTFAFSNLQNGADYTLKLKQDGTGGRLVAWPACVRFPTGVTWTVNSAIDSVTIVKISYDGTNCDTYMIGGSLVATSLQIVGTAAASNVTAVAEPSTPASGTGNIYEDSTSKKWCLKSDITDGTGVSCTTRLVPDTNIVSIREEFLGGDISGTAGGNHEMGWTRATIVAAPTVTRLPGTFANPGIINIATGATSGNGGSIVLGGAAGTNYGLGALGSNANWEAIYIFQLPSVSTTQSVYIGMASTALTAVPTDGFWLRYDTVGGDTAFQLCGKTGAGAETCSTSGVNVDTGVFHKLRIRSTTAGTIRMRLDSGTEKTIVSGGDINITPSTAVMNPFFQILTRTGSARDLAIDFFGYNAWGLAR
jgi:hypothetical protein